MEKLTFIVIFLTAIFTMSREQSVRRKISVYPFFRLFKCDRKTPARYNCSVVGIPQKIKVKNFNFKFNNLGEGGDESLGTVTSTLCHPPPPGQGAAFQIRFGRHLMFKGTYSVQCQSQLYECSRLY